MREELRIYGVFEPINAEVDSGWLPRNFGLSLAIKRASPSRIRQCAREEPCPLAHPRSSREHALKVVLRAPFCKAGSQVALHFV